MVVIGIGGVGLNVVSGAALAGASRIIAIDVQSKKRDLVAKFGSTDFIDATAGDPVAALRQLVPAGVDHAFKVVGIKATAEQAIKMARKGGTAYMVGMHSLDKPIEINVTADLLRGQVTVRGMTCGRSATYINPCHFGLAMPPLYCPAPRSARFV